MSTTAAIILEQIKALPVEDRIVLAKLFRDWETQTASVESPEWPDFAGRMRSIFGSRKIEGDPQEFWDEERGC